MARIGFRKHSACRVFLGIKWWQMEKEVIVKVRQPSKLKLETNRKAKLELPRATGEKISEDFQVGGDWEGRSFGGRVWQDKKSSLKCSELEQAFGLSADVSFGPVYEWQASIISFYKVVVRPGVGKRCVISDCAKQSTICRGKVGINGIRTKKMEESGTNSGLPVCMFCYFSSLSRITIKKNIFLPLILVSEGCP